MNGTQTTAKIKHIYR